MKIIYDFDFNNAIIRTHKRHPQLSKPQHVIASYFGDGLFRKSRKFYDIMTIYDPILFNDHSTTIFIHELIHRINKKTICRIELDHLLDALTSYFTGYDNHKRIYQPEKIQCLFKIIKTFLKEIVKELCHIEGKHGPLIEIK